MRSTYVNMYRFGIYLTDSLEKVYKERKFLYEVVILKGYSISVLSCSKFKTDTMFNDEEGIDEAVGCGTIKQDQELGNTLADGTICEFIFKVIRYIMKYGNVNPLCG